MLALSAAILQVHVGPGAPFTPPLEDLLQLFWLGTLVNIALSAAKLALAHLAERQKALMADAVHGLGDSVAEVLTAFAYVEAARPPDVEHPWGHGKIEPMGALLVGA